MLRGNDGTLYLEKRKKSSSIGTKFKQIESDVASAIESGKDFNRTKI